MAKCKKCEGKGWYENPKYIDSGSWSEGIESSFDCRKCKGTGFIIGNIKDVLSFLKHLEVKFSNDKEYLSQVKQCIKTIES